MGLQIATVIPRTDAVAIAAHEQTSAFAGAQRITVNPDDTGYRRLRSFFRSGLVRILIRVLPIVLLQCIAVLAGFLSKKSCGGQRNDRPARKILKPYAERLLAAGHQAVVSGHFHQPFHEKLGDGELIALGDWITQFSYAVYENRTFTLASYRATASAEATIP